MRRSIMTQTLTGQDIGQAHHATRAVLQRVLAGTGTEFNQWVTLNVLGSNGSALGEDELVARVGNGLKIAEAGARDLLTELLDQGLVIRTATRTASAGPAQLELTTAGTARFDQVKAAIAQISE